MKALIVDDSRVMRMVLARIVAKMGYDVIEAGDGQAALDQLEQCQPGELPAVALVDWNMPVMNGLEFVVAVRARTEYRDIALMMVTTESEHGQIVRALAAGAHEYLIKPFTADALEDKFALLGLAPMQESVAW
jgi:two-component system chemotaxis response regulator CheY